MAPGDIRLDTPHLCLAYDLQRVLKVLKGTAKYFMIKQTEISH